MKVKTSELSGAQLDWAVARVEGLEVRLLNGGTEMVLLDGDWWYPSESWVQGGPIIEREGIAIYLYGDGEWQAVLEKEYEGPTPLVAAMRCYVASKLGEEVEVPDDLA